MKLIDFHCKPGEVLVYGARHMHLGISGACRRVRLITYDRYCRYSIQHPDNYYYKIEETLILHSMYAFVTIKGAYANTNR